MKPRDVRAVGLSPLFAIALIVGGCGQSDSRTQSKATGAVAEVADHSGWWCPEHGVPEEECSMCSTKAAADFKKKGDWCKEHDRAESQCFICEPTRFGKFAARYEAKFGAKPPKPEANTREN